jgi:hypothetical protein
LRWIALGLAALLAVAAVMVHARALAGSAAVAATELLQREDDAVIAGDAAALAGVFTSSATASLRAAQNRLQYVRDWAVARGARFVRVAVEVASRGARVSPDGATVQMTVTVSEAFTYVWDTQPQSPQTFGLGTRRTLLLVREDGHWRIGAQTFIDPLDQETRLPGPATPGHAAYAPSPLPPPGGHPGYDPAGAVRYADTFCGSAPGCGNGGLYNSEFRDYNSGGGDCTNFASQILHVGGGIPQDGVWRYIGGLEGDGTLAWLRAPSLLAFLLARGRAEVLARGTYAQLVARGADGHAPADALAAGDMIAYFEGGRVVHFGLVAGRDAGAYPVVDTHTADRYHVPWDLGWDHSTQFIFVRPGNTAPTAAARALAAQLAAAGPTPGCAGG